MGNLLRREYSACNYNEYFKHPSLDIAVFGDSGPSHRNYHRE